MRPQACAYSWWLREVRDKGALISNTHLYQSELVRPYLPGFRLLQGCLSVALGRLVASGPKSVGSADPTPESHRSCPRSRGSPPRRIRIHQRIHSSTQQRRLHLSQMYPTVASQKGHNRTSGETFARGAQSFQIRWELLFSFLSNGLLARSFKVTQVIIFTISFIIFTFRFGIAMISGTNSVNISKF